MMTHLAIRNSWKSNANIPSQLCQQKLQTDAPIVAVAAIVFFAFLGSATSAQATSIDFETIPRYPATVDSFANHYSGLTFTSTDQWVASEVNDAYFENIQGRAIATLGTDPLTISFELPARDISMDFGSGQREIMLTIDVSGFLGGQSVFSDSFMTHPVAGGADEVRAFTMGVVDTIVVRRTAGTTGLVLDNLSFVTVPEPSSLLLAALALVPFRRRVRDRRRPIGAVVDAGRDSESGTTNVSTAPTNKRARKPAAARVLCSVLTFFVLNIPTVHASKLYWTSRTTGKIERANLDGAQRQDVITGLSNNYGLAVDEVHSRVYWTNHDAGTISRANLDGLARQTIISGLDFPLTIALDPAAGQMYWTQNLAVKRANLDGGNVTNFMNIVPLAAPYYSGVAGLGLDLVNQKVYASALTGRLQLSNLDGSNVQILPSRPFGIEGLALDIVHSHIYFADYEHRTIGRTALDGTGFQLLVSTEGRPEDVALDLAAGKMYWGELGTGRILRANLDGTGIQTIIASAPGVDSILLVLDTVPEPSTPIIVALGLVPFIRRSRALRMRKTSPYRESPVANTRSSSCAARNFSGLALLAILVLSVLQGQVHAERIVVTPSQFSGDAATYSGNYPIGGNPPPYGVTNNNADQGWILIPGKYFNADFLKPTALQRFRIWSVFAGDQSERAARWEILSSDNGTSYVLEADFLYEIPKNPGTGVHGVNDDGTSRSDAAGWFGVDFNAAAAAHRYWRFKNLEIVKNHSPRSAQVEFYGFAPVPEPSTLILAALAFVPLTWRRRGVSRSRTKTTPGCPSAPLERTIRR